MRKLPLSGLRVLDLSRVLAGPTCAQVLGDLGAEVIKIEEPGNGDESRGIGATRAGVGRGGRKPDGSMFIAANRNKKSIVVDLSKPAGQDLVRRLAARSDVFVENFKTGNLARYGLDAVSIRGVNPRIVYCSLTGFGQTGPDRFKPGYDPIFQARGGWMALNRSSAGEAVIAEASPVDTISGYIAVIGVLSALYHRDREDDPARRGQAIDIGLLDVAVASMTIRAQDYLLTREQPPRKDNAGIVLPCADGSIVVAVANDRRWKLLCGVLGLSEWARDPRFATRASRKTNLHEAFARVHEATRTKSAAELVTKLDEAGVPAAFVATMADVFDDPQVRARGLARAVPLSAGEPIDVLANPVRFSDTPIEEYRGPPALGGDTDEVLRRVLEMDAATIESLREAGVIA